MVGVEKMTDASLVETTSALATAAEHNSHARLPAKISEDEYRQSRMITDPINLLDASPVGGSGATVVTRILRKE